MCNYEVDLIPNFYCLYQNTPFCLLSVKFWAGDEDNSEKKKLIKSATFYVHLCGYKDERERKKKGNLRPANGSFEPFLPWYNFASTLRMHLIVFWR